MLKSSPVSKISQIRTPLEGVVFRDLRFSPNTVVRIPRLFPS